MEQATARGSTIFNKSKPAATYQMYTCSGTRTYKVL